MRLLSLFIIGVALLIGLAHAAPNDWEESLRPSDPLRLRYWHAMANAERLSGYARLLASDAENRLSASAHHYLSRTARLISPDTTPAPAYLTTPQRNLLVNDFDIDATTQHQTSSAAFGNQIVILYNSYDREPVVAAYSSDRGASWRQSAVPSIEGGVNTGEGNVTVTPDGTFLIATMAINPIEESTIAVSRSTDGGRNWSVAVDGVVDTRPKFFNDRPWIAVDETGRNVYLAWIRFETPENRASVVFNRSTDGGRSFLRPVELSPDVKGFDVGGVRVAAGSAGEVVVSWFNFIDNSIQFTRSTDSGRTFARPRVALKLGRRVLPTLLNGAFLTNSFASLAVDHNNSIYLGFNARPNEVSIDHADVFLISSTDGGESFTTPVRVNDDSTTTDQFHPAVTVTASGVVVLQWYDRRNDPAHNALTSVYAAASTDGGKSFSSNVMISDHSWPFVPTPRSVRFGSHGDFNQLSVNGDIINFHWADDRNGSDSNIYFSSLSATALADSGFALSARTVSVETDGGVAHFLLESTTLRGQARRLRLSVDSPLAATFKLSREQIFSGNGFSVSVELPVSTRPDTYPVVVTAADIDSGLSQSVTVRLVVLERGPVKGFSRSLTESAGDSTRPRLAIDRSGTLHVCWQDDKDGPAQVFYARSQDGVNFSEPINISRSYEDALRPRIAVDADNKIHIVWEERHSTGSLIAYTSSEDGVAFSPKRVLSTGFELAIDASISVGRDGSVNLAWTGKEQLTDRNSSLLLARSFDGGQSFTPPRVVRSTSNLAIFEPVVEVDSKGIVHVAYTFLVVTGQRFGNFTFSSSVLYARSRDGGRTFSEPFSIVSFINLTDSPVMRVGEDGQVFVMYAGFDSNQPFASREIYLSRSFDSGLSFAPLQVLAFGNGDSTRVDAQFDPAGNITVVWRDTQTLNHEIYLSRLFAGETSFTGPINVSQNQGVSDNPAMAIDPKGNITLVWQDDTGGSNEILTRRLTAENFALPVIEDFEPKLVGVGESFVIKGRNLSEVLEVKIGPFSARILKREAERLEAEVPFGAITGRVLVVSSTGISRSRADLLIKDRVGLSNTRVDFPATGMNSTTQRSVKIVNNADSPRRLLRVSVENQSFLAPQIRLPVELLPGAELELTFTFKPLRAGLLVSRVQLLTDDPLTPPLQATLSGVGLDTESPQIRLIGPLGGETFTAGQEVQIDWTARDNTYIGSQQLLFSSDSGANYTLIAEPEGVRVFRWRVPSVKTKTGRIRLVVSDAAGNSSQIDSGNFTIQK